jgi:hypothetical protein
MTDKEADALDEYYTQNTSMPDPDKPGFFAQHKEMFVGFDPITAAYLRAKAAPAKPPPKSLANWYAKSWLPRSPAGVESGVRRLCVSNYPIFLFLN